MTLNAQQENEKTIVKTQKTHIKHKKENRNRHEEEGKATLTRTVLSCYIDGVHQSSLRMCRDQQQQFPTHSPFLELKNGRKMHLENCCFHSLCLCWGRLFVLFGFGFGFRLLGTVLISVISSFRVDCFHSCCRISGHAD